MHENVLEELLKFVRKKAEGYVSEESVDEYCATEDGSLRLLKRKVTQKEVPPDISAAKLLLDVSSFDPYENMTEEELEKEKTKLLELLKEKNRNATN